MPECPACKKLKKENDELRKELDSAIKMRDHWFQTTIDTKKQFEEMIQGMKLETSKSDAVFVNRINYLTAERDEARSERDKARAESKQSKG